MCLEATMLNAFSVRWLEKDETKITFTQDFNKTYYVLKIDIIDDAIALLEEKKHQLMQEETIFWKNRIEERKNASI